MPVLRIAAVVLVAVGLLEMAMTSVAALAGLTSWNTRFGDLTRIDPSASLRVTIGALAAFAAVSLGIGFVRSGWWMAGGVVLAVYAGAILVRQIACGDTGSALIAYGLFTTCGVVAFAAGALAH